MRHQWIRSAIQFDVVLAFAAFAGNALAQNTSPLELHPSLTTTPQQSTAAAPRVGSLPAPVGRFQPRRIDMPPAEVERRHDDKDLDEKLRICKGC